MGVEEEKDKDLDKDTDTDTDKDTEVLDLASFSASGLYYIWQRFDSQL